MKFDNSELAANIRGMRGKADITQGRLVPGTDKLFAMAEALGCTPNDLLGWS